MAIIKEELGKAISIIEDTVAPIVNEFGRITGEIEKNLQGFSFDIDADDFADGERELQGLGKDIISKLGFGFGDPSSEYPKPEYHFRSSLNKAATGDMSHSLNMGGGDPALFNDALSEQINTDISANDLDAFGGTEPDIYGGTSDDEAPHYGKSQTQETESGHIIMTDDTPGNEKVLIKHNKGNGIELSKDGGVLIRSRNNLSISVDANGVLIFEGDLLVSSKNLKLDVTGDLDLNVTGDMNLNVGGDKKENIAGSSRSNITGNSGEIIEGGKSSTVIGSVTNTVLGAFSNTIKGDYRQTVNGSMGTNIKGQSKTTSETEIVMSTPNMNLAAADLTAIGATGTIGGEGIIMYNSNMYTKLSVQAGVTVDAPVGNFRRLNGTSAHYSTFHGSLNGKAANATLADGIGGGGSFSNTSADDAANDNTKSVDLPGPNSSIMNEYLTQSNRGIQKVAVDEGDFIKNKIVRYTKSGGIARKKLTTPQARAKLKDPNNAGNKKFVDSLIADGSISESYLNPVAPKTGRVYTPGKTATAPANPIRSGITTKSSKVIGGKRAAVSQYTPDSSYNPQAIDPRKGAFAVTAKTLVGQGIPISTFLAGKGSVTTLGHIATLEERQQLARNLLLQAEVIKLSKSDNSKFANHRLVVAEGVYKPEPEEVLDEKSPKALAQTGRAITYELYDKNGKNNSSIAFDFAEYLGENLAVYDEIRLDFDNLDPRGKAIGGTDFSAQITVIVPEAPIDFKMNPEQKVKTVYNSKTQSETDLVEITPEPEAEIIPEETPEPQTEKEVAKSRLSNLGERVDLEEKRDTLTGEIQSLNSQRDAELAAKKQELIDSGEEFYDDDPRINAIYDKYDTKSDVLKNERKAVEGKLSNLTKDVEPSTSIASDDW